MSKVLCPTSRSWKLTTYSRSTDNAIRRRVLVCGTTHDSAAFADAVGDGKLSWPGRLVAHPSTNQARRRVTSLIDASVLPHTLTHHMTYHFILTVVITAGVVIMYVSNYL